MNPRERILVIVLMLLIFGGGGGALATFAYAIPMWERHKAIQLRKIEIQAKQKKMQDLQLTRAKLEQMKQKSLPADPDPELASTQRNYVQYLRTMITRSGVGGESLKINFQKPDTRNIPVLAAKKPAYTRLTFTVDQAHGDLASIVRLLENFYRAGMMHKINKISVTRPRTPRSKPTDLDLSLTIEALVVTGAEVQTNSQPQAGRQVLPDLLQARKQQQKLAAVDATEAVLAGHSPSLLGLVATTATYHGNPARAVDLAWPPRSYASAANRNIFYGPAPPPREEEPRDTLNVRRFIYLTSITRTEEGVEAYLYDRYNNKAYSFIEAADDKRIKTVEHIRLATRKLRTTVDPDDGEVTLPAMTVVQIDSREVIFRLNDKVFNQLVRDETLKEDSEGAYKLDGDTWRRLTTDRTIRYDMQSSRARIGLTHAKVIRDRTTNSYTLKLLPFYALHVGSSVDDALQEPLSEERTNELLQPKTTEKAASP